MKILMPLSYDSQVQYFDLSNAQVTVTGNWYAQGALSGAFSLPDTNAAVQARSPAPSHCR
jgi:hypothetical protein